MSLQPTKQFLKNWRIKLRIIKFVFGLDMENFHKVYLTQRKKGFKNYGKYIENCNLGDYNWYVMAIEEIVDTNEYLKMSEKYTKEILK